MDVELVFAGRCPSESYWIEQSRVSGAAISQHERSVEENDTLGITDRSRKGAKAPKKRRRSHERPGVGHWVIDGALICPDRVKDSVGKVIFAALDDDPAVRKNGGRVIQRAVAVWQRSQLSPRSVHITAELVGGELPPVLAAIICQHNCAVGE